jgi:hypothetical protein
MKRIVPKIEILPNYLWHIFAISNLWDRNDLEYSKRYQSMISTDDLLFLYKNRNLLAWGNGRGGEFSGLLFFIPLSFSYITFGEYENYLELLIRSIDSKDWDKFRKKYELTYDMTDVNFTKAQRDFLKQYLSIIKKYYSDYHDILWRTHKTLLKQTSNYLENYFDTLNAIERWESFLHKRFPADEFNIILTVPNKDLPSANDLSRSRYNFYYQPDSSDKLPGFILHEIGSNLLSEDLHSNYENKELQIQFIVENNLIWQAFESLAEYFKSEIFKIEPEMWSGEMFGGGTYFFSDFYDFYKSYCWDKSDMHFSYIMKEAIMYIHSEKNR